MDFNYIYLLDGTRVINLLDIPSDSTVILISDKHSFKGVDFEDVHVNTKFRKNESTISKLI